MNPFSIKRGAVLPPVLSSMDVLGHSAAAGGQVAAGIGVQDGVAHTLARMLGVRKLNDLAVGGAVSCWPGTGIVTGSGGWGWVVGGEGAHMVSAAERGFAGPYLPHRHAALVWATENDMGALGAAKPLPMQSAFRHLLSWACSAAYADVNDAAVWTFGGTWDAQAALGGFGSGRESNYRRSATVGATATVTLPADYPGATHPVAVDFFIDPDEDITLGVAVDGVAQPALRLRGPDMCDTNVVDKHNTYCHRILGLAPGAHQIVFTLEAQNVAGSAWWVNDARIEADPQDGPLVIVPSCFKPVASDYSLWASWPGGASMNDATLDAWKGYEQAVVGEFGDNLLYRDIDEVLGQDPALFHTDKVHLNEEGSSVLAQDLTRLVRQHATLRRQVAPAPAAGARYTRVVGFAGGPPYQNSWGAIIARQPLAFRLGLDGLVHMRGDVLNSAAQTNTVMTNIGVGFRPPYDEEWGGVSGTGVFQRWRLQTNGNLQILTGGNAARSNVGPVSYSPISG